MAFEFASWAVFLHLLLALCAQGDGSIGANVIRLNSMDDVHDHVHAHPSSSSSSSSSSHMHHMDPQLMVFFIMEDLKVGKVMPVHFPNRELSSSRVLPKQEADSIPFASKELPYLLNFFSFSEGSPQAKAMEDTLKECEAKPIKGETKFCATSMESVHDFTGRIFGSDTQVQTLTTTHLTRSSSTAFYQNYTVVEISQDIPSPKLVACHTMPYPYTVFYCHSQESENKVLMVRLEGENEDVVEALSVCHMDTSHWNHNHVAFQVLGVEPGSTSVCHFFPRDNFVFIPFAATM